MVIVIPMFVNLTINIITLKYIQKSSRRIQPTSSTHANSGNILNQLNISRRNVYFLRHMIFLFIVFLVGLCPLRLLVLIDTDSQVNILVYKIFTLNIPISLLIITTDLFLLNSAVMLYLKEKYFSIFRKLLCIG